MTHDDQHADTVQPTIAPDLAGHRHANVEDARQASPLGWAVEFRDGKYRAVGPDDSQRSRAIAALVALDIDQVLAYLERFPRFADTPWEPDSPQGKLSIGVLNRMNSLAEATALTGLVGSFARTPMPDEVRNSLTRLDQHVRVSLFNLVNAATDDVLTEVAALMVPGSLDDPELEPASAE